MSWIIFIPRFIDRHEDTVGQALDRRVFDALQGEFVGPGLSVEKHKSDGYREAELGAQFRGGLFLLTHELVRNGIRAHFYALDLFDGYIMSIHDFS